MATAGGLPGRDGDGARGGDVRPRHLALGAPVLLPYDRLAATDPLAGDSGAFVVLAGGVTPAGARPAVQAALAGFPTARLLDADTALAQTRAGAEQLLGLVFGLLLLSILIALLGVTAP